VRQVAARVIGTLDNRFEEAAAESRMRPRMLSRRKVSDEDRQVIRNRAYACGIVLEDILPPEASEDWQAGLLRAAMALDDGWERLERVVVEELDRYRPDIELVRGWRRPLGPLWVWTGVAVVGVVALGLSLGGYLPAPGPLGALQTWFWSLPWP
jgi:hypothetical protein